jgi:dienelactone hydrolase
VFGITTTLLDAAIRFAREGFEVLIPDVLKTDGIGAGHHIALRSGAQFRGGVDTRSRRVGELLRLYADALDYLRGREMVDPTKTAVFGASYGGSLALALAAKDTRLAAVALAYPVSVRPVDLAKLVTAPLLFVAGSEDRQSARARAQLVEAHGPSKVAFEYSDIPNVRHGFLSRDLSAYEVGPAELAWSTILAFLKRNLMPPPPKPPAVPPKSTAAPGAPAGTPKPPTPTLIPSSAPASGPSSSSPATPPASPASA